MKSLFISAACIIAIARLCRNNRHHESESPQVKYLPACIAKECVGNLNKDPGRPYELFNFYYPPGQTSIRFH